MNSTTPPSLRTIFRFWAPLAATWFMMATEGPYLAAVIARLPDPKFNLAAFGVTFAFAIIVEAPVIMMMSASTALVDSAASYRKLRNFAYLLNGLITGFLLLILIGPVFSFLMLDLIGLEPEVARLTRGALFIMLPWPAAIGYRRFYQGLLIRNHLTRRVAYGTVVRLIGMVGTGLVLFRMANIPGAWVGGAALTIGVCAEAVASRLMARRVVKDLAAEERARGHNTANTIEGTTNLTYRSINRFYYPLALTATISLAVQPMVTFFMGQARYSLESLAVLPVINSLVFIFRAAGLSYQEVAITLLEKHRDNMRQVCRFAAIIGISQAGGLALIALTPLSGMWFEGLSGLSPELAAFAVLPAALMIPLPAMSVLLALQRGILVSTRRTQPITGASIMEVSVIIGVLIVMISGFDVIGATAAAGAFCIGRLAANIYLLVVGTGRNSVD